MGWLRDWRRKRVLTQHRMDEALWGSAAGGFSFIQSLQAVCYFQSFNF